jgi:hypothetical protein
MSPSELRCIEGEDVWVRRHLHVLDPCHLAPYDIQAAAERHLRNGDLQCERRRRGSLPDDKSSVPYSSNIAVKISHTPEKRRSGVTHPEPERGGSPAVQWQREESPLAAPHGGSAATEKKVKKINGLAVSKITKKVSGLAINGLRNIFQVPTFDIFCNRISIPKYIKHKLKGVLFDYYWVKVMTF